MTVKTARQIAAGQRRSLRAMAKKLADMAAEWGDVDTYCEKALADLAEEACVLADSLTDDSLVVNS